MDATLLLEPTDLRAFARMSTDELADLAEIATMLRVHKRTAQRYVERDDFPEPMGRLASGRIWARVDVEKWGRAHLPLPKPGRPPKKAP